MCVYTALLYVCEQGSFVFCVNRALLCVNRALLCVNRALLYFVCTGLFCMCVNRALLYVNMALLCVNRALLRCSHTCVRARVITHGVTTGLWRIFVRMFGV